MRWSTGPCSLAATFCLLMAGCDWGTFRQSHPRDPLLTSRKPVEARSEKSEPVLNVRSEPTRPDPPAAALASAPSELLRDWKTQLAGRPELPSSLPPALPTAQLARSVPVIAQPAVRRRVAGTYGHAADHSWLQGIVSWNTAGHLYLRYLEPDEQDALGGWVCLEADRRLASLKDGEVVYVEGEIVRERAAESSRYRVRSIRVLPARD